MSSGERNYKGQPDVALSGKVSQSLKEMQSEFNRQGSQGLETLLNAENKLFAGTTTLQALTMAASWDAVNIIRQAQLRVRVTIFHLARS